MRLAADANCAVVPTGAQSWLDAGNQLSPVDLKVDLRRLNRILEHEPADLIATAEAGVRLNDLNRELAAKGQWLPLDPPDDGTATLGGIVATGLAGPQKLGYGPPRRFVIGMKLVLADGRVIKVGGKVVKNVAGYDLCKLFTGSYGTLGIICELTFKLRPQPAVITSLVVQGQIDSLLAMASAIHATSLAPVAMEILSANFAEQVLSVPENSLLLRFAGSQKAVAFQIEQSVGMADRRVTRVIERDEEVWRTFSAMTYHSPAAVISRIVVPTSAMPELLGNFHGHAPWHAGLGTGIIRTFDNELAEAGINELRKKAERLGGFLVIEKVPAELKPHVDCWGDLHLVEPLMTRLKKQLDPANVLSPGRF
jgi:FAD/FMN-containing dehydrogenase